MRIEEFVSVEFEETADQFAERRVRLRADCASSKAEELRQRVSLKRHSGNDAEAATATTFDRPEEIRVGASVGDAHHRRR